MAVTIWFPYVESDYMTPLGDSISLAREKSFREVGIQNRAPYSVLICDLHVCAVHFHRGESSTGLANGITYQSRVDDVMNVSGDLSPLEVKNFGLLLKPILFREKNTEILACSGTRVCCSWKYHSRDNEG